MKRLSAAVCILLLGGLLALCNGPVSAGTTGKISGRVVDAKTGDPLPNTTVAIQGTKMGAAADVDGYYAIINIPSGKYSVQVSLVGYRPHIVNEIIVSSDNTTKLDVKLEETGVIMDALVVTAERPVVEVNLTSARASLTSDQIQALPVQELSDVVNLQAGVVDGHFRGGRAGEVQYQVNGVSVNNPYDNTSSLRLDRSLLQEVQVMSGTFDAEYGQAMSGVVNAVLKSGGDHLAWNAEAFSGDYFYPDNVTARLLRIYKFRPGAIQSYQLSLSGPLPLPQTTFLVSGRRFVDDSYFYATRVFMPTDTNNIGLGYLYPTGDLAEIAIKARSEWTGLVKLTNRSIKNVEIGYQAIINGIQEKKGDFSYVLIPDAVRTAKTFSIVHGIDLTQTLSNSTFYNINIRQNYFDYKDYLYESVTDPRYFEAGLPKSIDNFLYGAIIQGVSMDRFLQKTNSGIVKFTLTSQLTRDQLLKFGAEFQYSKVEFGQPGYILSRQITDSVTGVPVQQLVAIEQELPKYPGVLTNHPISGALYVHDQIEWNDLNIRAGVRWEYFDARAYIPSDLQNPANAIAGSPLSIPQRTTRKAYLAPRLGISYPITTTSAIFFSYGHFYQYPGLKDLFTNTDYNVLKDLQAGQSDYTYVMGNPDMRPEKTVQYEFGYKNAVTPDLGINGSIFYKDVRDYLGVEFISTYAAAEYARLTNVDFGNVYGFTVTIDQRQLGPVSASLNYTWQMAQGNTSDPRETATAASAGKDPRPVQAPLDWDQRHTLNFNATLSQEKNYSVSMIARYQSGEAYTPSILSGFDAPLEKNSESKPASLLIDLRGEKNFSLLGADMSVFIRVFNLLDTRYSNGFIFTDSGSPDYTSQLSTNRTQLADPTRFYQPRRFELGLSLNSPL